MGEAVSRPPIERRVTPWVSVESRPEWAGSGIAAYRIWIEFDGRHWYQMHEWERSTGNRERWGDGWINGIRGWPAHALPATEEPPVL